MPLFADTPPPPHREPPPPAAELQYERARRRKEFFFAALAFVVVLLLTTIQLDQFRSGDALFVVMFNVNFVLLLGILFVVLRNGIKLLLERRRKVLGSRLRTRLVLAFVGFSLLPCLLMFLVTTKYVQLSMDFWFKDQVETSMESALDVARGFYEKIGGRLVAQARSAEQEIKERRLLWGGQGMSAVLERKRAENGYAFVGLYTGGERPASMPMAPRIAPAWEEAVGTIDWEQVKSQGSHFLLVQSDPNDFIFGLAAVDGGKSGFLVFAEDMGEGFKARLDRIARGAGEYKNLRKIKKPLKLMLYSSLGVLTTLIILGAIWFGFRVAREISAPVNALAAGTAAIAKGDLSVRLTDRSQDELGMLIESFNRMVEDLEQSQREITGANAMLEEQNLRIERHSKYIETVLNNIAAGVVSFDSDGRISTVNKAACEILSMEAEELLDRRIEEIFPEHYGILAHKVREQFRQRIDSRTHHNVALRVDGEDRHLLVNVVGFSTDGVYRGAVAVFEDITEFERMQRMAAWREVARRIAHEIKNPLTPIKLSAQRLARKFGTQVDDPAFSQSTKLIERQVEHLQEMVQEFSAFAKLPEVNPETGTLPPLLESLVQLFRDSHSKIRWKLKIAENLPPLPMDKSALNRALMNILTNAAEALEQSCAPMPFVCMTVWYQAKHNVVRIDVADNGPGLTDEERSRLFEPYFTHKKGGTGLGLTIVRSIISDHRGYIRALPREGGGTIMSIELPVA